MPLSDLLRIAGVVFLAVSFIVVGDTAGKVLTAEGVSPVFIAWTRFGLAAIILLPLSGLTKDELRYFRDPRVLARGALIACAILCIMNALRTEPIANVFGAFFIGPIVSFLLAMLFLGERPSKSRTVLLAVGFIGVMFVVKPGFGASVGILFALASGTLYGCFLATTRTVSGIYRPRLLLISQLLMGSLVLTPLGLTTPFPELDVPISALILLSSAASAAGNYLLVLANKAAEASLIAPLIYSQLFSATVAGVLVFGDWPDAYAFFGLVLIAFSGFGSLIAQRVR